MGVRGKSAGDHARTSQIARAWALRCKGWTQTRIAHELGIDQGTVSRWLEKTEKEENERIAATIAARKATQNAILETILDEAMQAWERSKAPAQRMRRKPGAPILTADNKPLLGPDGKPVMGPGEETLEVIARDGNRTYLDLSIAALAQQRRLWGLDVQPKPNDEGGPKSYSAILARLRANVARHDAPTEKLPDDEVKADAESGTQGGGPVQH